MAARREFSVLRKQIHHDDSSIGAVKFLSAAALLGLGAGLFFMLPDNSNNESPVAAAAASVPEPTADESFCDKQAWPYVDQRCAKRVEAARGTRQVRIVTDKGHSVTAVTPMPIVEPKAKPASPAPSVAQAERPIGPAAAPAPAMNEPSPQVETVATAPKAAAMPASSVQVTVAQGNRPATTHTVARETSNPPAETRTTASINPSTASTAPMAPGFDAFAESPKKSKSARAAEKAEKREAKRLKAIEAYNSGVPDEVGAVVKSAPAGGQYGRLGRRDVPDEVVRAVEEASANDGRRGRGMVTIGSPNGGQRIYMVPREAGGW